MKTLEEAIERVLELTARVDDLEMGKRKPFVRKQAPLDKEWPSWRYPPNGKAGRIFASAAEVPEGWLTSPVVDEEDGGEEIPLPETLQPPGLRNKPQKRTYTRRAKPGEATA